MSLLFRDYAYVGQQGWFTPEVGPKMKHHGRGFHNKGGRCIHPKIEPDLHADSRTNGCDCASKATIDGAVHMPAKDSSNMRVLLDD